MGGGNTTCRGRDGGRIEHFALSADASCDDDDWQLQSREGHDRSGRGGGDVAGVIVLLIRLCGMCRACHLHLCK